MASAGTMILIPAFNEENAIYALVQEVQRLLDGVHVVVVNDGSVDNTAREAKRAGATVLQLPTNLGIGAAVQCGYQYAVDKGYHEVVRIDGDGQHRPEDINQLLKALREQPVDLVIGSRFLERSGYRSTRSRRLGIRFFARLLQLLTGQQLTDVTSGFRALRWPAIQLFAQTYPVDYPEVESLLIAARTGLTMAEVPVNMNQRRYGVSSITGSQSLFYMLKVSLALATEMLRRRPGLDPQPTPINRDGGHAHDA